jgi:peroxiredoxin
VGIVALSTDTVPNLTTMDGLVGDAIDVYCDPCARTIQALGLLETDGDTGRLVARPTAFVIDALGQVRYRYVSRNAEDRPKAALLLLAAESLRR